MNPRWLLIVLGLFSLGCGDAHEQRPLKIVVPFAPGGESDTFARIMKKAIEDNNLYDGPIVIVNLGGAGGTIGSRYVKDAKPDGYTVLLLHDAILTAKYFGKVRYGADAFEPVAGTGQSGLLVVVGEDPQSPFHSLDDLLRIAKDEPDSIVFGANMGAPTHFVGLQMEHLSPGSTFRFTQTGGGSSRFAALKGKHITATVFSVPEYLRFQPKDAKPEIRALAYLGETRHPDLRNVPTAREQGIDITSENMQMWWVPLGTPRERIVELETILDKAMQTDYVQTTLAKMHTTPTVLTGEALRERLEQRRSDIAKIPPPKPIQLPNFALMIGAVIAVLVLAILVMRYREGTITTEESAVALRWRTAGLCIVEVLVYALVMNLGWLSFRSATLGFVLVLGMTLSSFEVRRLPAVVVLALMMGFGVDWLFTSVFVVDLP